MSLPAIAGLAFAVALLGTPLAIVVARRTGIVDRPGELKSQASAVPYLGGVAVFAGTAVGVLSGRPTVLVPLAAALALGVADDRFDLPPLVRLAGEVGIGVLVVVVCPVRFPGFLAAVSIVTVTVILVNGVNLLDGLDLLAGGVVAVAAVAFAVLGHGAARASAVALAASLLGFLVYNRPPARIYLGDGGAYLLGAALAAMLAESFAPGIDRTIGWSALALVAIPAAEVAFALIRRVRGRMAIFAGDRGHPYDRMVARGWPRLATSLAYVALEVAIGVAAVAVAHRGGPWAALVLDLAVAVLLVAGASAVGALTPDRGSLR